MLSQSVILACLVRHPDSSPLWDYRVYHEGDSSVLDDGRTGSLCVRLTLMCGLSAAVAIRKVRTADLDVF
ncbi:MAG: hypothetical protein U0936_02660 [Planctomycetaceae bacterium]